MKRLQQDAVVVSLVESLQAHDSWCGETHIQKATYFIKELFNIPLDFDFILYKHGPFSFDLSDELAAMRADTLLGLQFRSNSYGPSIVVGDSAKLLKESCPKTLDKYTPAIEFVATRFGNKGVSELERIATALYVKQNDDTDGSVESRAQRIIELKPHVEIDLARDAVKFVDAIIEEVPSVKLV